MNKENFTHKAVVILDAVTGEVVGESKSGDPILALAFLDASRRLVVAHRSMHIVTLGAASEPLTIRDAAPRRFSENEDADGFWATHVVVSPNASSPSATRTTARSTSVSPANGTKPCSAGCVLA